MNYDNMTPDQIVDAVIAQQRAKGLAQYGAPLAPNVVPNVLEALREAIDGMHYLAAEVARLTGQRCVSCRWLGSDALSCHNLEAPAVEFDRERIEAGGTFGDPTTFGCPMWEGKEVQE